MRIKEILTESEHNYTTAYHITPEWAANSIMQDGLVTGEEGRIWVVVDTGDKKKLIDDLSIVYNWMLAKTDETQDPLTMLKVDIKGIPLEKYLGWYTSTQDIPANRITNLGDGPLMGL